MPTYPILNESILLACLSSACCNSLSIFLPNFLSNHLINFLPNSKPYFLPSSLPQLQTFICSMHAYNCQPMPLFAQLHVQPF
jgi:hypothetical protein